MSYVLQVMRATGKPKKPWETELLSGRVEQEDAEAEARALLGDPRDTIHAVMVWTTGRHCQHVMTYRRPA